MIRSAQHLRVLRALTGRWRDAAVGSTLGIDPGDVSADNNTHSATSVANPATDDSANTESTFGPAAPPRFGALHLRSVATGNSVTKE